MENLNKQILLVDMDAFFASVEQQCNPALRGKPVAVVGPGKRTVITTASYEARSFGVKTGMTIPEALECCPQLIIVRANNAKYTYTSQVLSKLYQKYTPLVEIYSVDEAFLDVTGSAHLFGGALELAKKLKSEIGSLFGLKATVGIGPNRLVAKTAAEISKPDGLREITPEQVPEIWKQLPVDKLWGVGPRLARKLNSLGIKTAYELGQCATTWLKAHFGLVGVHLKALGLGIDPTENVSSHNPKSIAHSITLQKDIEEEKQIRQVLLRLSEMVASRARKYNYEGKTIALTVKTSSFTTTTRRKTLTTYTNNTHTIYLTALDIFKHICPSEPVRLLGIALTNLRTANTQPALLSEIEKIRRLLQSIDTINEKHGAFTVCWANTLTELFHSGVISPAWRPSGLRRSLY